MSWNCLIWSGKELQVLYGAAYLNSLFFEDSEYYHKCLLWALQANQQQICIIVCPIIKQWGISVQLATVSLLSPMWTSKRAHKGNVYGKGRGCRRRLEINSPLACISKYMDSDKLRILMRCFVISQFQYSKFNLQMFKYINKFQYQYSVGLDVSPEMFKTKEKMNFLFMKEIFRERNITY